MKHSRSNRWYAALAVLMLLSLALAACGAPAAQPAAPTAAPAEPTKAPAAEPTAAPVVEATKAPAAQVSMPTTPEEGEKLIRNLDSKALPEGWQLPKKIGYVVNLMMHEWYQNVTKGNKARAEEWGIDLTLNDANLDLQKSLAGIDDFLAADTDVILFTPVDQKASTPPIKKAMAAGVPVILESSPTEGAYTLVAINDYSTGYDEGVWAGNWWKENMAGVAPSILSVTVPQLTPCLDRANGFIDGMKSVVAETAVAAMVDGKGLKDEAIKVSADALTAHPDINVINGCNDDSTFGGLQSYEAAGLDMTKVLAAGFGCEGNACKNALMEGGPYKVSAAMFPEFQGRLLIDAAIGAYNKVPLPQHIVVKGAPVTAENLSQFYTKDGDAWLPNYEAIAKLNAEGGKGMEKPAEPAKTEGSALPTTPEEGDKFVRTLDTKALPEGWQLPKKIGYVVNLMMHEWYQNVTKGNKARAEEWGIDLTLNDANLDLQKSLAGIDDFLAADTDVILFTPVDQKASTPPIKKAMAAGVPVILESSPTEGAYTLVAINDYDTGYDEGVWAGNWWKENMAGVAPSILSVTVPQLTPCLDRANGFIDGMKSVVAETAVAAMVDGKGLKDEAIKVSADALTAHPDINVINGCNDDSTFGGLQSYEAAGLDMTKVLAAGFGCEGNACKNALMEGGPYKVSAAMFPEFQGRLLIDAAIAAYNKLPLPQHIVVKGAPVTAENLSQFYTKDGDTWVPNYEAIAKLNAK